MRIIAGEFRSRVLRAPKGIATRPTSDRLRETLFNVLGPSRVEGARFLDLYAGSAATGLEALIRGARDAGFVEQAAPALAAIRANAAALGVGSRARVEALPARRWLARAPGAFEVVFLDPPYAEKREYAAALGLVARSLAEGGIAVAEHRRGAGLAEAYPGLERTRVLEQGDAALSFFKPTGFGSGARAPSDSTSVTPGFPRRISPMRVMGTPAMLRGILTLGAAVNRSS